MAISPEKQKLEELHKELVDIRKKLREVLNLQKRELELVGSPWGGGRTGEIEKARIAYYDSLYPIFEEKVNWEPALRITKVDGVWIHTKRDGVKPDHAVRYKMSTGRRERSRSPDERIDVEKAMECWSAWCSKIEDEK
jgi:hypothetical protein